ncbi:MAG: Do family serine endopeptidase [Helicobacteraceae bacterium]
MKKLVSFFVAAAVAFAFDVDLVSKDVQRENPTPSDKLLSYSSVLKLAKRSVVSIAAEKTAGLNENQVFQDPFFRQFFDDYNRYGRRRQSSLGSGVIISKDGYIVTNNHVIDGAQKVIVQLSGSNKEYEARIVGADPKSDLAVIKIQAKDLSYMSFYDSDKIEVGDLVFAIGNPFGIGETVTSGIISATNRNSIGINEYEDFLQTDAPINPGNSGGALVNSLGYLVGINSAILTRGGGSNGVGFSIPSNMVARIAKALIEKGVYQRARLGITIGQLDKELSNYYKQDHGVLITSVSKDSPAQNAGLLRGDLILEVDGVRINSTDGLRNIIGNKNIRSVIELKIARNGKILNLKVNLAETAADISSVFNHGNFTFKELDTGLRARFRLPDDLQGVMLTNTQSSARSSNFGLQIGDVVVQVEQTEIKSIKDLKKALTKSGKKRFFIYRGGNIFVAIF